MSREKRKDLPPKCNAKRLQKTKIGKQELNQIKRVLIQCNGGIRRSELLKASRSALLQLLTR